jgi:hypothetical protein
MALLQPALSISEIEKETLSTKKNSLKLKLDKNEVNDIASVKQTLNKVLLAFSWRSGAHHEDCVRNGL